MVKQRKISTIAHAHPQIPSGNSETDVEIPKSNQSHPKRYSSSKKSGGLLISLPLLISTLSAGLTVTYGLFLYSAGAITVSRDLLGNDGRVLFNRPDFYSPRTILQQKPRMVGFYLDITYGKSIITSSERLDPNDFNHYHYTASTGMSKKELQRQADLADSDDYRGYTKGEPIDRGECVAQFEWQRQTFTTCNNVMEQDWTDLGLNAAGKDSVKLLANGYFRDVWRVKNPQNQVAMKTLRYEHDFTFRNYDRHRRDALAMERMTSSPYIVDIYGFCGNTGLFEFADGGSVEDAIDEDKEFSPIEKVTIAHQLASGLADLHFLAGKEDVPTIAHTDITSSQFVKTRDSGIYKLNDFNRCRFLPINEETNEICPFHIGKNAGKNRSPEEYEYGPETEKVDVYSLGNVFYEIFVGDWTFDDYHEKAAQELVMKGERPVISDRRRHSKDPYDQVMIRAIEMCWIHDAKKRHTSREVHNFLAKELKRLKKHSHS